MTDTNSEVLIKDEENEISTKIKNERDATQYLKKEFAAKICPPNSVNIDCCISYITEPIVLDVLKNNIGKFTSKKNSNVIVALRNFLVYHNQTIERIQKQSQKDLEQKFRNAQRTTAKKATQAQMRNADEYARALKDTIKDMLERGYNNSRIAIELSVDENFLTRQGYPNFRPSTITRIRRRLDI